MTGPVQILYLYASADAAFGKALETQLAALSRQELIQSWHEGCIQPGQIVATALAQHIHQAEVLILLVSADLFASDQSYALLQQALRRHDDQGVVLIPVIVRPVEWQSTPLGGLRVLPEGGKPVITWPNQEEAWLAVVQAVRGRLGQRGTAPPPGPENPYRGLLAFQEEHAAFFCGREELTRQLWQAFYELHSREGALRLLCILGPSGSGKSSVARAGLVPLLRREPMPTWTGMRVVVFTPGERPIERMAQALLSMVRPESDALRAAQVQDLEEQVLRRRSDTGEYEGLRRFASSPSGNGPAALLLLVDQFEEVYAQRTTPKDRDVFVALLLHAAADPERHVSIVLTMRNDFFEETRQHPELNRAIAQKEAHILVPVMRREELRRAIFAPAAKQGRPLDAGTVELLLAEAGGRQGALPLLEFALTRIWQGLGEGKEPARTLLEIGGVGGALAGEAQRIYEGLEEIERQAVRRMFQAMVQLGEGAKDTRRRVRVEDLVVQGETLEQVRGVLRRFAQPGARLITMSADDLGGELAEVTHEALFDSWQILRGWIDEGREDIRFHRRVADAAVRWNALGRPAGSLWHPPELQMLGQYAARTLALTPLELDFYRTAIKGGRRRRLAIFIFLFSVFPSLLLLSTGVLILFFGHATKDVVFGLAVVVFGILTTILATVGATIMRTWAK